MFQKYYNLYFSILPPVQHISKAIFGQCSLSSKTHPSQLPLS
uniref:Uncharacterized protein n=1 Tax=Podoviridae sp. ctU7u6 TaxID=2825252 RepID=A0A8S5P9L6_9CAUD|nr:MAG TPA: hypothetical protein [Podoviridae sp. ctU7u6]